jgi:hypothetical protein
VGRPRPEPASGEAAGAAAPAPSPEEMEQELAQLQEQLARTPAEVVVANHAFGLFELAALHLSQRPPRLGQARVAIDALAALVEGMQGRLGEAEPQLAEALSQLRMAFVQISQAPPAGGEATP